MAVTRITNTARFDRLWNKRHESVSACALRKPVKKFRNFCTGNITGLKTTKIWYFPLSRGCNQDRSNRSTNHRRSWRAHGKRMKFATKLVWHYPPHLWHVPTLTWEITVFNLWHTDLESWRIARMHIAKKWNNNLII